MTAPGTIFHRGLFTTLDHSNPIASAVAIKDGRIIVVPTVREFTRDTVIFDNGVTIQPDIVIAATGYRTGLEAMLGKLGVLDEKGVPLFNGADSDPKLPGLWFTGMRPSIRGCFANARIQAKAIAARIARERKPPRPV